MAVNLSTRAVRQGDRIAGLSVGSAGRVQEVTLVGVHLSAAVALTAHLNACRHTAISTEVAARAVVADHAAHHVVDPEGLLGLDTLAASELDTAMAAALLLVETDWILAIARPGRLAPLTGPPPFTTAALDAGAVVLPGGGGPAWVPHRVGPAIQWRIVTANPPAPAAGPGDAHRHFREVVLHAGRRLEGLPLGTTERPDHEWPPLLPGCYGARAQQAVARAWQVSLAMDTALADDGSTLHVHASEVRRQVLTEVRDAADAALCAAVSWTGVSRD